MGTYHFAFNRVLRKAEIEDVQHGMGGNMGYGRASPAQIAESSSYGSSGGYGPGWRRMANRATAKDTGFTPEKTGAAFVQGDRVFHQKFGMGNVASVDGDKLEIVFDHAGRKKVVSGFVSKP